MDNLEHYRMKIGMYIHQIHSRRNCSKSGSKSCRFRRKIIILLWLVISVLSWSLANDSGIEKNLGPTFIQLKSNEQSLFLDIKKINNKIVAAASYRFFSLYVYRTKSYTTRIQIKNVCLHLISVTVVA